MFSQKIILLALCTAIVAFLIGLLILSHKDKAHGKKKFDESDFFLLILLAGMTAITVFFIIFLPSHCKKCGENCTLDSNYCNICGEPYKVRNRDNQCPQCFTANSENSHYCRKCGVPMKSAEDE